MRIRLNGEVFDSLQAIAGKVEDDIYCFLQEWFNEKTYVVGRTSGSTGKPKEIRLNKRDMQASAKITNTFLGIQAESVLLLCLSVSYIAGKMMVVRALEADADLWTVKVSAHPMEALSDELRNSGKEVKIDLAAMVPMQVEETLKVEEEKLSLMNIRQLLVGGAPVSMELEQLLQSLPIHCYATYGMTETVSHVALREMDGSPVYFAVGDVVFSQDERGCLVVHAPHLQTRDFVTNDLVRLIDSRHFEWLGRYDHVINSGGIKFFPEVIESKIASYICTRFFVTSLPDKHLGQRIVLVLEGGQWEQPCENDLLDHLRQVLTAYEMPKEIIYLSHFQETGSGKVIRKISPNNE